MSAALLSLFLLRRLFFKSLSTSIQAKVKMKPTVALRAAAAGAIAIFAKVGAAIKATGGVKLGATAAAMAAAATATVSGSKKEGDSS